MKDTRTFIDWLKEPISNEVVEFIATFKDFNKTDSLDDKFKKCQVIKSMATKLSIDELQSASKRIGCSLDELETAIVVLDNYTYAHKNLKNWKFLDFEKQKGLFNLFFTK